MMRNIYFNTQKVNKIKISYTHSNGGETTDFISVEFSVNVRVEIGSSFFGNKK